MSGPHGRDHGLPSYGREIRPYTADGIIDLLLADEIIHHMHSQIPLLSAGREFYILRAAR